jgi:hypothetical protein
VRREEQEGGGGWEPRDVDAADTGLGATPVWWTRFGSSLKRRKQRIFRRARRPETTTLHRIVREHLETYLALANESDLMSDGGPDHVEKESQR